MPQHQLFIISMAFITKDLLLSTFALHTTRHLNLKKCVSVSQGTPGSDGPPGRDGAAGVKVGDFS